MIKKSLQEFRRVSSQRRKITESLRKRDAHEKIRLGGLIIKAELHREDKDVILSLLVHAKDALYGDTSEATRASFRHQGKRLWDEHDELERRGENE